MHKENFALTLKRKLLSITPELHLGNNALNFRMFIWIIYTRRQTVKKDINS